MISGRSGLPKLRLSVAAKRFRADGVQIAPAFGHRLLAAFERIGLAIARRHVGGEGERLGGMAFDAHDARIAAGQLQRIALDQRVILLPDPAAGGLVRPSRRACSSASATSHFGNVVRGERGVLYRLDPWPVIFRRFVAEFLDRQVGDFLALMDDAEAQIVGGLADDGEVEAPFDEDGFGLLLPFRAAAP